MHAAGFMQTRKFPLANSGSWTDIVVTSKRYLSIYASRSRGDSVQSRGFDFSRDLGGFAHQNMVNTAWI